MKTCAFVTANATENTLTSSEQFHVGRERCAYKICNALASFIAVQPIVGIPCTEIVLGGEP